MSEWQALKIVDELKEAHIGIEHINISGGDAFTEFDLLRAVVDKATSHRILTSVGTSAYWGLTYEGAVNILTDLRDRGLWLIAISVDDEKQKVVPLQRVVNVIRAAQNVGVRVWLCYRDHDNDMTPGSVWSAVIAQLLARGPPLRDDYSESDGTPLHNALQRKLKESL